VARAAALSLSLSLERAQEKKKEKEEREEEEVSGLCFSFFEEPCSSLSFVEDARNSGSTQLASGKEGARIVRQV
jgi:hypothetical protein